MGNYFSKPLDVEGTYERDEKPPFSKLSHSVVLCHIIPMIKFKLRFQLLDILYLFGYFRYDRLRHIYMIFKEINLNIHDVYSHNHCTCLDFAATKQLQSLTITVCDIITTFHFSTNLQALELYHCKNLKSIKNLRNLTWLSIRGCNKLVLIENLDKLMALWVTNCDEINSIKGLKSLSEVWINHCPHVTSIKNFNNLNTLDLTNSQIKSIENLPNLEILNLGNCPNITSIGEFKKLNQLELCNCKNLERIKNLKHLNKVIIKWCPKFISTKKRTVNQLIY